MSDRLRVAQWATGNIGSYAMRSVIEHPTLDLVGVYVYSEDKAGRDAGELCGVSETGVKATRDMADIVAAEPDCVLYMPRLRDFGEVCALLSAGIDVVTTRGEFRRPESLQPAIREQVEAAGDLGGASVHSTGSSPGFITEALPLVLTSIERRLDRLAISEFADLSRRPSPELLFDLMGFGKPPADLNEARLAHGKVSFGPSLTLVAEALGMPLEDLEASGEVATAAHDVEIAAGKIAAGTVTAQRLTVAGMRGGHSVLQFTATWYCSADVEPAWAIRPTGWHVSVEGDAPLDISLVFPVPPESFAAVFPAYTANRAVNVVPYVCAAEPGIRTVLDLPQIVAMLGPGGAV